MALVTEWKFEGDGTDVQGTQNATANETPVFRNQQGQVGWYSEDYGDGNVFYTPYNSSLDFNSGSNTTFSVSCLCKLRAKGGVVCQTNDLRAPYGDGFLWKITHIGSSGLLSLSQGYNRSCGSMISAVLGQLHHICLTVDCASAGLAKVYLDGSDTGNNADLSTFSLNQAWNAGYTLGDNGNGEPPSGWVESNRFRGTMYDLRFYNTALSSTDVGNLSDLLHERYAQYRQIPVI